MAEFPEPKEGSVFYEDEKVYACLAFHPIVAGHSIVVWKANVEDLNDLTPDDYHYFIEIVYRVRRALLSVFDTDKVYLAYLDEARHVHASLFPRKRSSKMEGFELMAQPPGELTDFSETVASLHKLMI